MCRDANELKKKVVASVQKKISPRISPRLRKPQPPINEDQGVPLEVSAISDRVFSVNQVRFLDF